MIAAPAMSEYCEYMWDPFRGQMSASLARDIYAGRIGSTQRDEKLAIKTVRAILRQMPDIDLKKCTDEYITRFLLARKYDTEETANLIAAYQGQLNTRRDIFENLTARDPALQRALRAGIPGVLPARDRKGRCVLIILASQWDPIAVPTLSLQRAIFLVLEILIQDPRNQQSGFVVVIDWNGFTIRQGSSLGLAALRNLIGTLRGRFPARFKAVHFLSAPIYVQATLALVKPFLDDKIRRKIHLHGNNLSTLHEFLPTDILPAELGGTGPAFNPGLWAEPVIHSAMKEAEIEAAQRQKELAEKSNESAESITNEIEETQGIKETRKEMENIDERNEQIKVSKESPQTQEDDGKLLNRNLTVDRENVQSNAIEMNLINRKESSRIHDENANDQNVQSRKIPENQNVENQNENKDKDQNKIKNDNETNVVHEENQTKFDNKFDTLKDDDFAFLDFRSEMNSNEPDTNSNDFETIYDRPDIDDNKDDSLDNNSENVLLEIKSDNNNPSEEMNLIA